MHHAVLVQVVQRIANGNGQRNGAVDGQLPLLIQAPFIQNGPQQPALHPLDHHVGAAALFAVVGLHHAGVVNLLADLLLAAEALEQNGVGFHLRMRHLHGHRPAVAQVSGAEKRGHAAAGNLRIQEVVIQGFSNFERGHDCCQHRNFESYMQNIRISQRTAAGARKSDSGP